MSAWTGALAEAGFSEVAIAGTDPAGAAQRDRPLHVLTAARTKLEVLEISGLPWPERALATIVDGIELINLHSPISARPGLVKVRTHEALGVCSI